MKMSMHATAADFDESPTVADRVAAYGVRPMSCTSVWEAYRDSSNAPKADDELAHAAYTAGLDRDDAGASAYSCTSLPQMHHCNRGRMTGCEDPTHPRSTTSAWRRWWRAAR
jgi:hypothetical protein